MAVLTAARRWLRAKTPVTPTPAATFADWLTATVRSEFVLCEVEPSKTVMGFTAVGGPYTNTFVLTFPRFHQTDVIEGGMFGAVVGVQEDDTLLTARATLAEVDSNAGSYWWDAANELLYVHSSSGADPDTFTLVQAAVRFYLSSAPITLELTPGDPSTAVYYLPWLTGELPRVRRTREDLLFGSMSVPVGTVSFTNGHGAWWTLVAPDGPWNWKYKPVRFFVGGGYDGLELTRAQYLSVATMRLEDTAPNEAVCQFPLIPLQRFADLDVPVTPFFASDYPALGSGVEGTKKWIGYGRTTMRPDLTDVTSYGVYTVADAAFQTLFAVHAVWAIEKTTDVRTPLILTTDYTVDLTACTVTVVNATYTHEDYELAIDVTGKPDGVGGYLRTFSAIAEDLIRTFLGAGDADIDMPAFAAAAAAATNEISVWLKSPRSIRTVLAISQGELASLARSAMGTVQQTIEGTWTTSIWNVSVDDIDTTLQRGDFTSFLPKPKLKTVFPTVQVFYNYNHASDSWSVVEKTDARTRYRTGSREQAKIYTFLRNQLDAQRLAERYQLLAGGVTVEAAFIERGALLARKEGGGKAFVTYSPAPAAAGGYLNQPFEILEMEVVMAPKLGTSGVMGNFHGLAGRVGRVMPNTAPNWSTATALERQASGFVTNNSGLADPGDPSSANQSIIF